MKNVTFIIGNGFDLSLGLKTSYRDFYEHVKTRKLHPENRIYKAIQESPETWADFETRLGQYTHYIDSVPEKDRKKESINFHEELDVFREDLADYLGKQEKSIENPPNQAKFTNTCYFEELAEGQARIIRAQTSEPLNIQFVTLNYTSVLKTLLPVIYRGNAIYNTPLYIHGTLLENLTLGVSDESQLSASMTGTEKDDLIKPNLIYSMNDSRIDILEETINNSKVIVLFGTSIGETDMYIWKLINDWLDKSMNRYLIIHKHDNSYLDSTKRSSRKQKQFNSNVQDKILGYSGLDGNEIDLLRDRIFVIHNTKKLFCFSSEV